MGIPIQSLQGEKSVMDICIKEMNILHILRPKSHHLSASPCSEWKFPLSVVNRMKVLSKASWRLNSSNMIPQAASTSVAICQYVRDGQSKTSNSNCETNGPQGFSLVIKCQHILGFIGTKQHNLIPNRRSTTCSQTTPNHNKKTQKHLPIR